MIPCLASSTNLHPPEPTLSQVDQHSGLDWRISVVPRKKERAMAYVFITRARSGPICV